jgi:hypothetical protein
MHSIANVTFIPTNTEEHSSLKIMSVIRNLWLFIGMVVLYLVIAFIIDRFILTKDVYYRGFAEQMTAERIEAFLEMRNEYWWMQFLSPVIIVGIKASFTALCITIGIILIGQDITFAKAFKVALLAECVFVLAMAVQVAGGLWFVEVRVPDDYANFAPLSLLQLFDPAALALWMKHPLRTVNLFEVAYMLVLAWLVRPLLKKRSFRQTFGLVAASYGVGLLLWVVVLAFLLLQVS